MGDQVMLKLNPRRVLGVVVVALAAGSAVTARPAHADKIVLESYTGTRPPDADKLLRPLLDELRQLHFTFGVDNVGRAYDSVSHPAVTPGSFPADFDKQIEKGHSAYVSGNFVEAEKILVDLVDVAHSNAGVFATNDKMHGPMLRGLIDLALSQQRKGDPTTAELTFKEVIRSYPEATVSRGTYGPAAATFFDTVKHDLEKGTHGTLRVKSANGAIYLNEHLVGVGDVTKSVPPGEYRVFAQSMSKEQSRVHRVTVAGGSEFEVKIDLGMDASIHTAPAWVGLAFANQADRDRYEGAAAASIARSLRAESVAIVGVDMVKGRPMIVGVLVDLDKGRDIRRASIPADGGSPAVRSLAAFLAGHAYDNLQVEEIHESKVGEHVATDPGDAPRDGTTFHPGTNGDDGTGHQDRVVRDGGLWGGYKYISGGLGAAALVTGGILLALDGRCQTAAPAGMQCTDVYSTSTPAFITLGAGGVFAAISIVLFVKTANSSSSVPSRAAYVVPTNGGAVAGVSSSF